MKGKPELDVEENLAYLCKEDHDKANSYEWRLMWWRTRLIRHYGETHIRKFYDDLPMKVKVNF